MTSINAYELKEFIMTNDKVPQVLEDIGCHSITSYSKEYRAALPNGDNKTAVAVRKHNLSSRIYTANKTVKGDIISIAMDITEMDFINTLKKLHNILGLEFTIDLKPPKKQFNPLQIFENIRGFQSEQQQQELVLHSDCVLYKKNYIKLPHMTLVREGVIPVVQNEFDVMYDMESKRILFPHRHWSSGDILGIFGRTTIKEWKMLGYAKYFGVLPYSKSLNLYGLYQNYKSIQNEGYVVVFEGEKSTMKAKSLGFPVGVALGGHELSKEQIKILIGLDVDIIFALDKDVPEDTSKSMCKEFKNIRNAYYIHDQYGILDEKDAPIDKGVKIFEYLLKYKRKVS